MIVGSRMPVILDAWTCDGVRHRLCQKGEVAVVETWSDASNDWYDDGPAWDAPYVVKRLVERINVNNIEARRISFLASALMRCLQLAERLVEEAPAFSTNLAKRHLAALKGVALACGMPLERWKVDVEGVEEDPETVEARRRLGLDVTKKEKPS